MITTRGLSRNRVGYGLTSILCAVLIIGGCVRSPEQKWNKALERGRNFVEKKDYARAMLEFRNAIQALPERPQPYYELALVHLNSGDFAQAIALLRKANSVDPNFAEAQLKLSQLMAISEDPEILADAKDRLLKLLKSSPDHADALTALAMTEWKLGKPADAESHLQEALRKVPRHLDSAVTLARLRIEQKDYRDAERILRNLVGQAPSDANALIALGEFYLFRNRWAEAADEFRRALKIEPQNAQALQDLASAELTAGRWDQAEEIHRRIAALPDGQYRTAHAAFLLRSGKLEEALREFSKLATANRADRTVRGGLVTALVANQKIDEAEKVLSQALEENQKDLDALLQRSSLLLAKKKYDEVERDLNQVLRWKNDSGQARYLLAKAFEGRKQVHRQRQELGEVLRIDPGFLPARLDLAALLIQTKAAQAAIDLLDAAPAWQRNSAPVIAQQNWARLALGQKEAARKGVEMGLALERTVELVLQDALFKLEQRKFAEVRALAHEVLSRNPEDKRALELLIWSYRGERQPAEAIREIRSLASKHPRSATLQLFLGNLLVAVGRKDEARAAYRAAQQLDPSHDESYLLIAQLDVKDGQRGAARQALKSLVDRNPRQATAYLWLGHLSELEADHPAAIEHYRRVLELDSANINALNNLAFLLAEHASQADEALAYAQKAKELRPADPAVSDTLGWVYFRKGLYSLAATHLEESVRRDGTAKRRYHLAMAYSKVGRHQDAQRAYEVAKKLDPEAPEALVAQEVLTQSRAAN